MIIAVDFDGTCVTHEYPNVGKDIGAVPVLRWLVRQGHKIILWTMRGNLNGDLGDAIAWFKKNKIPLYGVNKTPTQEAWTQANKAYAQVYIDDAALGCPLVINPTVSNKPYVYWPRVKALLAGIFRGDTLIGDTEVREASHDTK